MPNACVPANAVPWPSLTRRSLLAGLTAAGTSPSVALAQTVSDAEVELLALAHTFDQSIAAYETAQRHYDDCERRYFDLRPKPTEILTARGPLGHLLNDHWGVWRAFALRRLLRNPERSELWEQAQAALPLARAYEADIKAVKHKTGVAAADAANRAAIKRIDDLSGAILIARARTLSGLAVKAQVVKRWGMPDWWDPEADTYESLAAQIIDAVIAAGVLRRG